MTGTTWIEESGFLEGPVMITNTHSVGVVRDAVIQWRVAHGQPDPTGYWWSLPVVAETWDGWLNDINGFHVKPEHAFHAIDSAHGGTVEEGAVGGGTGNGLQWLQRRHRHFFRKLGEKEGGYAVVFLCNATTARKYLRIAGIPVGREIFADDPYAGTSFSNDDMVHHRCRCHRRSARCAPAQAPRSPSLPRTRPRRQHFRHGSGDIFIAFSTANPGAAAAGHVVDLKMLPQQQIDPVFAATVQATEEAIINAMIAAETMTGINEHKVIALPHDKLRAVLKKYNRLAQ